jgi:hypothetical protein
MENGMIHTAHQIILGDQIRNNEMGGAGSKYGGDKRCIKDFGGKTWQKETKWKIQA